MLVWKMLAFWNPEYTRGWYKMASAEIQCPTRLHDGTHEVKTYRGEKQFIFCTYAKSNFTFRSDAARRWLEIQNGGTIENPSENSSNPRKEKDEMDRFLEGELKPNPNLVEMGKCYNCQKVMPLTTTRCPRCGADIDWEE